MHINEDGSSFYIHSRKRRISWEDIKYLFVRKSLSLYILYFNTFFSRVDVLYAGIQYNMLHVNYSVFLAILVMIMIDWMLRNYHQRTTQAFFLILQNNHGMSFFSPVSHLLLMILSPSVPSETNNGDRDQVFTVLLPVPQRFGLDGCRISRVQMILNVFWARFFTILARFHDHHGFFHHQR